MTRPQQQLARQPRREMSLSMVVELTGYQPTEIALISRTVAVGAPLEELAVFLHACRTLNLDPLLRQAYWIRRGNPPRGALQVGIDGFRAIAERAGNYAGSSEPVFRGYQELGQAKLMVPVYCQVTCWKIVAGHKAAFTGEARWDEFYPGEGNVGAQWRQRPHHMLAKCAEAQALRKGWPAQLASLSMEADDEPSVSVEELPTVAAPRPPQEAPVAPRRTYTAEEYDKIFYGADAPQEAPAPPSEASGEEGPAA